MADATFRQGGQKGTVYDGPPLPVKGTVYNGPSVPASGGTVYKGPAPGGTVYNGAAAGAPPTSRYAAAPAATGVNVGARKGANIFYVIAGFTALRTLLLFAGVQQLTLGANRMVAGDQTSILMVNAVVIGIFVALGIFTQRGYKVAVLIGMALYGIDTVLLVMGDASANIIFIGVHLLFIYYLFNAYRQFAD
jgi:hypothetical protein